MNKYNISETIEALESQKEILKVLIDILSNNHSYYILTEIGEIDLVYDFFITVLKQFKISYEVKKYKGVDENESRNIICIKGKGCLIFGQGFIRCWGWVFIGKNIFDINDEFNIKHYSEFIDIIKENKK